MEDAAQADQGQAVRKVLKALAGHLWSPAEPPRSWPVETDARDGGGQYHVILSSYAKGEWEGEWTGYAWSEANAASRARAAVGQMAQTRYAWTTDRAMAWSGALLPETIILQPDSSAVQSTAIRARHGAAPASGGIPAEECATMAAVLLGDAGRHDPRFDAALKIGEKQFARTDMVECYVIEHLRRTEDKPLADPATLMAIRHLAAIADLSGGDAWATVRTRLPDHRHASATQRAAIRARAAKVLRDIGEPLIADRIAAA